MAASSATVYQSPALVPKPALEASSSKDTEGGNRVMLESIMEAVQSLSSRMSTLESGRNSTDPSHVSRPSFERSHEAVAHSTSNPAGTHRGLRLAKGFPGREGENALRLLPDACWLRARQFMLILARKGQPWLLLQSWLPSHQWPCP